LLVIAGVLGWTAVRRPLAGVLDLDVAPGTPPRLGALRVVSWNLHNFPGDHDRERLAARLRALEADVLALQEVVDVDALRELLPDHDVVASTGGGRHHQHVALALRREVARAIGEPLQIDAASLGGFVRPLLLVHVRAADREIAIGVVHLKAKPEGLELRRLQWSIVAFAVGFVRALWSIDQVIVVGDFNTTGAPNGEPTHELRDLDVTLAVVDLERVANPSGCTAYWDGSRRDGWLEPSVLDLAFWTPAPDREGGPLARPWGACARHRCQSVKSTEAHPDADVALSDHCPLVIDL
jgi:endonuclease/exonuclease/phosphatase family metal-dependent hydrolase